MALDANDIKQIGDLIVAAAPKLVAPPAIPPATPDPAKDKTTLDLAAEKQAADKRRAMEIEDAEAATKFEIGLETFKKDNKEYLPDELEYILSTVEAAKIENKAVKVKEIKSAIMELFFKKEKNMEVLNNTQKAKAKAFLELTREAKRDSANQYWEVLELAIDGLKNKTRFDAAQRSSGITANSGQDKYAEAVFARSAKLNILAKNTVTK